MLKYFSLFLIAILLFSITLYFDPKNDSDSEGAVAAKFLMLSKDYQIPSKIKNLEDGLLIELTINKLSVSFDNYTDAYLFLKKNAEYLKTSSAPVSDSKKKNQLSVFSSPTALEKDSKNSMSKVEVEIPLKKYPHKYYIGNEDLYDFPKIEFTADVERGVLFMFSDIYCGYCVAFHSTIKELNVLGITVIVLPYPSNTIDKMPTLSMKKVLCSADSKESYHSAMVNRAKFLTDLSIENTSCPVVYKLSKVFNLAKRLKVIGTPALFFQNGTYYQKSRRAEIIKSNLISEGLFK